MLPYLLLILAWPLGKKLAGYTSDEKNIYSKRPYFPFLVPALGILTILFWRANEATFLTLAFMYLMTYSWSKQ